MKYVRSVAYTLATMLLYLGLPLLGWGINDLFGFFSSGPRAGYAVLIAIFALAVGVQSVGDPQGIRGGEGEAGKLVIRQRLVRVGLILILYLVLVFLPYADRRSIGILEVSRGVRWIGLFFSGIGLGLVFWSGVALGRMYSQDVTIQKDHRLVTNGPYRYIRHPRYLGVMVTAAGISLLFRSWLGLTLSFLVTLILYLRIRDEEAVLLREFGQEWEDYCQSSWRLLPYLY